MELSNRCATRLTWCFLNVFPGRLNCLCHVRMFPLPCSIPPAEADLAAHPQKAPAPVPSRFKRLFRAESCGTALTSSYPRGSPGRDNFLRHTLRVICGIGPRNRLPKPFNPTQTKRLFRISLQKDSNPCICHKDLPSRKGKHLWTEGHS